MIVAKTRYKTYNSKLLTIVEVFKIWKYYLKGYKYRVFIFIDYKTFFQFIHIKSWSFY